MPPLETAPNRTYVDVNVGYELKKGVDAFVNIQNLFDKDPPIFNPVNATHIETPTDKRCMMSSRATSPPASGFGSDAEGAG